MLCSTWYRTSMSPKDFEVKSGPQFVIIRTGTPYLENARSNTSEIGLPVAAVMSGLPSGLTVISTEPLAES